MESTLELLNGSLEQSTSIAATTVMMPELSGVSVVSEHEVRAIELREKKTPVTAVEKRAGMLKSAKSRPIVTFHWPAGQAVSRPRYHCTCI